MGKEKTLNAERLRSILSYDPKSGAFTWLSAKGKRVAAGALAGSMNEDGYVIIRIDGRNYRAHRLAWLYMTGRWPACLVDHRNRRRSDNRWHNLRAATYGQNCTNRSPRWNRTGYTGVKLAKDGKRFEAYIRSRGKMRSLGGFSSAIEAHEAYCRAAAELFGEFVAVT